MVTCRGSASPIDEGPRARRTLVRLRASFYVHRSASSASKDSRSIDREIANARVGIWPREVANVRVHADTGEIPLVRLERGRKRLQPIRA